MDGLLIDSEPLWVEAMQEVFATVDVHISPELAEKTTGLRTEEVIAYWYREFRWNGKGPDQVAEEIIETTIDKIKTRGKLQEGVEHVLSFFKKKNFKIGLASSSPLVFINTALQHFGIREHFAEVHSAQFEKYGKPHPSVYLACADALGSEPMQCLAFEDSINGMIAAKAARMKVVVVPEGHHKLNPRFALADLKLDSLLEFSDYHFEALNV